MNDAAVNNYWKYMCLLLFTLSIMFVSSGSFASSHGSTTVHNKSTGNIFVIWRAAGCAKLTVEAETCKDKEVDVNESDKYSWKWGQSAREVYVYNKADKWWCVKFPGHKQNQIITFDGKNVTCSDGSCKKC